MTVDYIVVRDASGRLRLYAVPTLFGYTGCDHKGRRIADLADRDAAWAWLIEQSERLELPKPTTELPPRFGRIPVGWLAP